jgi:ABC-type multidrug transport system fused ATPase/permease subunit
MTSKTKNSDGKRVLRFLIPYKSWVFADSFVIAITQVGGTVLPTLSLSWFIDKIIPNHDVQFLWILLLILCIGAFLDWFFMVVDEYFCHQVAKSVTNNQKMRLYKHLQLLPFSFYSRNKTGELLSRISDDPDVLHNFLAWEGSTFMAAVQGVIMYSAVIWWLNPYLMIVSVITGVLFYFISSYVGGKSREASASARKESSRYLERIRESVTGIHLSRVLGVGDDEIESVTIIRQSFVKESIKELYAKMKSYIILGSYNGVGLAAVYSVSYYLIKNNELTNGEMLAAGTLVSTASWQINNMLRNWLSVKRTGPALDRSELLLGEEVSKCEAIIGIEEDKLSGDIVFKEMKFTYEGTTIPVLKNINFTVKEGETVAIVGPSGSGKSTISDLLIKLYSIDSGEIMIGRYPIDKWDTGFLRNNIAVVSQDIQLKRGSIADNIRIGKLDATEKEIMEVVEMSGLTDLIESLPEGILTEVGERGSLLSGGQKQRISLARALIKEAPYLVLDEASSALDPITETKVNEAIKNRAHKQTILIISHRLSSILSANKIVVIDNGTVVETGTHDELLLNEHSIYSTMFGREALIASQV